MENKQIKIGVILSYVVIFLNMIIGIGYTPFLTNMLGQSEYGLYSLVASIISYLTVLDLGFASAITVYTAKYKAKNDKENESKLHGMFFIIYIIIAVIAGGIGLVLYMNVDNLFANSMTQQEIGKAKILMLILTFNLVITFSTSIFSAIITAYEKFIFNKLLNILRIIGTPILMIPLLFLGYKSVTLVILTTLINIICVLINMFYCFKKLNIKLKFGLKNTDFKLLIEIFAYSFFIFLNAIIDRVNWSVDNFILGIVSGTISVSLYSVATQFNSAYICFSTAISGVLLPKISMMEAQKASDEEFSEVFIKTGRIQYIIVSIVITGFLIFGKQFIEILFGENYIESYYIACILMLPLTYHLIQNVGLNILKAKNKYKVPTIIFLVLAIVNVIASIPLAKTYGGIGTSIATSVTFVIGQILMMNIYYYKKININIPKFWKEIAKMTIPIVASFFIGVLAYKIFIPQNMEMFIIEILLYTVLYAIIMWKFGMNNYEKNIFSECIKQVYNKLLRRIR